MTRVKKISISFLGATVLAAACLFALMFCFGTGGDKTRSVTARAAYSLAVGAARDGSGEHEGHGAGFTAFDGRKELTTGNYYLTGNTATRETLVIPLGQKVTLCLNGYVLKGSGGAVIRVYGELTVCDCYLNTDENRHFFSDGSFTDGEGNFLTSGTDLIEGGIITGGVGSGTVGAITNSGKLTLKDVSVACNGGDGYAVYNTGTAEDLELYNVLIACNACNGVYSETDVRINGSPVIRDNGRRNVAFAKGSGFIMGIMTEAAYIVINDVDAIGGYIGMKRGGSVDTSFLSFPEGYQAQLDFSAADFLYIVVCKTVFSVDGAVTTVQVPYGTSIKALSEVLVYPQIPQLKDKPSDMTSHYFARWVDGEGNVVGLEDPVRRPLSLFASYRVEEHTLSVRDTAPTCTEAGHRITSCAKCGYVISDIETAEPGAHSVRVLEAVEPDCTHTGLTEGSDCSVCGQILIPQRTIAALGHTPKVSETAIEPDCTHDGRSESSVCAVCGVTLSVSAPVGATGHTPVKGEALAPTCTEQGHTAGAVCSVCGETVTEQEPIPATGHEWGVFETVKDPTESEPGLRRYKCKHCDATEDVEVPKIVRTQEGTQENTSLLWLIAVLAVVLEGECAFFAARIHAIAKRKKRKSEIIGSVVPPVLLAAVIPSQIPALIGLGAAVGVMAIAIGLTFVKKR